MFEGLRSRCNDTGGVDVFQTTLLLSVLCNNLPRESTYQDLVEEVLDELLLEGSRGKETVQIGAQQFGDKITVRRE